MSWHDPHTYRVGELAGDDVDMDEDVSENLTWLHDSRPGARIRNESNQSLANDSYDQSIAIPDVVYDVGGDMTGTADTLTIPRDGFYLIGGSVNFNANGNGRRWASLVQPGHGEIARSYVAHAGAEADTVLTLSTQTKLEDGDTLNLGAYQNSGGSLTLNQDSHAAPVLFAQWLRGES